MVGRRSDSKSNRADLLPCWRRRRGGFGIVLSIGTVTMLLLTAVVIVVFIPGRAAGESSPPVEVGWIGYAGNSAIYPSNDLNATYLAAVSIFSGQKSFPSYPNNTLEVGVYNTSSGLSYGPGFQYFGGIEDEFFLTIPLYAVGGANFTGVSNPVKEVYDVGAVKGAASVTGLPSDETTQIKPGGNFRGLNTTHSTALGYSYEGDASWLGDVIDTGLAAAAPFAGPFGIPIAAAAVMNAWAGYFGAYTYSSSSVSDLSNNVSYGSDPSIAIWGATDNGTFSSQGCKYSEQDGEQLGTCGRDVFAESFVVESSFPDPADVTPGTLEVSATNQFWAGGGPSNAAPTPYDGANASISYLIEPTVGIGGTVDLWPGGPPAADTETLLVQDPPNGGATTDFENDTNSAGNWHFFAMPGATYGGTVTYSNGLGSDTVDLNVPSTSASYQGQNHFAGSATTFSNVGELKGSVTSSTTGGAIGSAEITLTNNANDNATSVVANSGGDYSSLFYYPVTTASNSFGEVAAAPGYCPASATLTDLKPETVNQENFKLTPGCSGGGGCVAFGTPILTSNGYVPVQQLRAGTAVVEFNLSSGQLTTGSLVSANVTPVTKIADINSGVLYLTPTDQPIFIRNSTFEGWLHDPQNLTASDQLFDPITGAWISVTSVEIIGAKVNVYDVVTSHLNDFVANGYLLDTKAA